MPDLPHNAALLATIETALQRHFPAAQVKVLADDPDGLHLTISVTAPQFKGLPLLQQHRQVQDVMKEFFQNGMVHAIKIRTQPKS